MAGFVHELFKYMCYTHFDLLIVATGDCNPDTAEPNTEKTQTAGTKLRAAGKEPERIK